MSTSKNHRRKELNASAGVSKLNSLKTQKELTEIERVVPEVLQKLPKADQDKLKGFFVLQQKMHSGPIPSAEDIAQYNIEIPDGANRIMIMAEKEQSHRIEIDKMFAPHDIKQSRAGQKFSFLFLPAAFSAGIWLTTIGSPVVGGMMIFFAMASTLSATHFKKNSR